MRGNKVPQIRITHIGGATTLLEVGGLRLLEIDEVTDDLLAEPLGRAGVPAALPPHVNRIPAPTSHRNDERRPEGRRRIHHCGLT